MSNLDDEISSNDTISIISNDGEEEDEDYKEDEDNSDREDNDEEADNDDPIRNLYTKIIRFVYVLYTFLVILY